MSWFLFLSNQGENGVGECEFQPGIKDTKNGALYVVPTSWILKYFRNPRLHSPKTIEKIIYNYYYK